MRYVTPRYERQLQDLAETLVTPRRYSADLALQATVMVEPDANVIQFPGRLRLSDPLQPDLGALPGPEMA